MRRALRLARLTALAISHLVTRRAQLRTSPTAMVAMSAWHSIMGSQSRAVLHCEECRSVVIIDTVGGADEIVMAGARCPLVTAWSELNRRPLTEARSR